MWLIALNLLSWGLKGFHKIVIGDLMNKYLRGIGIISILCFSFYFTSEAAIWMKKKDPIYETIVLVSNDLHEEPVNAIIDGDYIIPGLNAVDVDVNKSFRNMKYLGYYDVSSLAYEEKMPTISVEENKDKIIKKGNPLKNAVSIIIDNQQIETYFEEMSIPYGAITTHDNLNQERKFGLKLLKDNKDYELLYKKLKDKSENNDYCLLSDTEYKYCQKNKIKIKFSLYISKANYANLYSKVSAGDIIYFDSSLDLASIKVLIDKIEFQGLKIVSLEKLLSESRM